MHNFHRAKKSRSSREPWKWQPATADDPQPEETDSTSEVEESESESENNDVTCLPHSDQHTTAASSNKTERVFPHFTHHFHDWSSDLTDHQLEIRNKKGNNTVLFFAEASLLPSTTLGEQGVILFRFRGQAFLLQ
jgi:hypothetical protein